MGRQNAIFPIDIVLFGAPRVSSADGSRTYRLPRRTLDVLAYLVLNRHRAVSRSSAAFALFPDDGEDVARASLRRNLWYLLDALPTPPGSDPFVLVDAKSIAWNSNAPAAIDLEAFERAVAGGADDEAIAIYRGELLPTLYSDWIVADRERLRGAFHEVLLRKILDERSRRRFDEATAVARRLLQEDPWREDVVRLLMAIRHEAGDRGGALAEYDRFVARMHDEMQADPMPQTTALRDAVLRGRTLASTERPGGFSPSKEPAEAWGLPFVGRTADVARAIERWHMAADGRPGLLFVAGEAGIGKSRFVTELARKIEREGGTLLRGHTSAPRERRAYEAFVDALQHPTIEGGDRRTARIAQTALTDDRAARVRFFERMRRDIVARARERPLAVIVEDLHVAGDDTIALLEYLGLRLRNDRVLLLVTMRTEELSRTHALRRLSREMEKAGAADVLTLARLDPADAAHAIHASVPNGDEATIARAVSWADGVPLLLQEAAREIAAGRADNVNFSIEALVGDRFARLTDAAVTTLSYAAAAGAIFELVVVSAAMGWPDAAVIDALATAVELGLVRASESRYGTSFAFTHHVIHRASYERIALPDRSHAHAMIARVLTGRTESGGERAKETARHFELAGEPATAARYLLYAARYAVSVFANEEARATATSGLELAADDASLRFDLLLVREEALRRIGGLSARRGDAIALLETAGNDPSRRWEALERKFIAYRDDRSERKATLREMLLLRDSADGYGAAYDRAASQDAFLEGDYVGARDAALRAALGFERLGDKRAALLARFRYIAMLGHLDDFAAVQAAVSGLRPVIEQIDDLPLAAEFYRVASAAAGDERREDVLADARRALEMALRIGDRYTEARARQDIAYLAGKLRHYAERSRELQLSLEAYRDVGDAVGINDMVLNLAAAQIQEGDFEGALRTIAELRSDATPSHHTKAWIVRGYAAMRQGRLDEAVADLTRARDGAILLKTPVREAHISVWLAEALWLGLERSEALQLLETAILNLSQLQQPGLCAEAQALWARFNAELGNFAKAKAAVTECRESMRHYPVQDRSQASWHLAVSCALQGDDCSAYQLASEAARAFVDDALQMDAGVVELFAALPWHQEAVDYLAGKAIKPLAQRATP